MLTLWTHELLQRFQWNLRMEPSEAPLAYYFVSYESLALDYSTDENSRESDRTKVPIIIQPIIIQCGIGKPGPLPNLQFQPSLHGEECHIGFKSYQPFWWIQNAHKPTNTYSSIKLRLSADFFSYLLKNDCVTGKLADPSLKRKQHSTVRSSC